MSIEKNEMASGINVQWSSVAAIGVLMATIVGGSWTLIQSQFNAANQKEDLRHSDVDRRLNELRQSIARVEREIDKEKYDFMRNDTFMQFQQRFDQMQKQLTIIESTRPTTGELQAVSRSLEKRIEMMEGGKGR